MKKILNVGWYTANKVVSTPFYLAGLGAAKELNKGVKSALQGTYQLPYDFFNGVVNNEGIWSFAKGTSKTALGIGQSMIESPLETTLVLGAGLVVGKALAWKSERFRQYKRDEPLFKEKYGIN